MLATFIDGVQLLAVYMGIICILICSCSMHHCMLCDLQFPFSVYCIALVGYSQHSHLFVFV